MSRRVYLECGVGLALGEKVAPSDWPYVGELCKVEVDCTKTWIVWCIYIAWYDALDGIKLISIIFILRMHG
jgi:hypothetical protein